MKTKPLCMPRLLSRFARDKRGVVSPRLLIQMSIVLRFLLLEKFHPSFLLRDLGLLPGD